MESIVQFVAIFVTVMGLGSGIIGWAIKQGIINPLSTAIETLQSTIVELKKVVDKMQENQHDIDKRLGILEEQLKVANHRIEDLEREAMHN
jgi:hypothetical protein